MDVSFSFHGTQYPFRTGECCGPNVPPNFVAELPSQTHVIPLPADATWALFYVNGHVSYRMNNFIEAWPDNIEPVGNGIYELDPWYIHGGNFVSGKVSMFANETLLGSSQFKFFMVGSCGGHSPSNCINEFGDQHTGPVLQADNLGEVSGKDLPIVKAVFDDMRVEGRYNDDRGTFYGAEYTGQFTLWNAVDWYYDTQPVAEVPLPSALGLFIAALMGLAAITKRRKSRR